MASGGETLFAETLSNDVLLYRLQILICDGGLLVLRNILDQTLAAQGITLRACLDSEKSTVRHLKNRGVITQEQYDILFPDYDRIPTTTDMDISLVICLLRNLKCFGLSQRFDWDATPISSDVSVEADICRLRTLRDKICHMSTTSRIQPTDFATVWSDIEEVLVRRSFPALNMQQIIADFKNCPLDPEESKKIQKEVKKWKDYEADVGRLEDEMKEISANVSDVSKKREEIKIPQYQNRLF
ncbi:E3 ubiquitin-protein ligase DZIP3-like [Ruditapes philippinarum]|uniref:E3 ubiquitin-protein ligase DZIP3-like n=1 Tax=Ruditapes philippinarum TaxID=129788 RepID=UPI00295AE86C|nr:E3 ubiquitin-protein ligase DZIP3-like [Ruditapes philippinarum]